MSPLHKGMRVRELSLRFHPPSVVVTIASEGTERVVEFAVPPGVDQARDIVSYLLRASPLFQQLRREARLLARQLAASQVSPGRFRFGRVVQPHFAPVVQIVYSRECDCFVSASADCSACVLPRSGSPSQIELPARPSCVAEGGGLLAFGLFGGSILICTFDGRPLHRVALQSLPTSVCFARGSDCELIASLFDGRVVSIRVGDAGAAQIRQLAKHSAPAIFACQASTHRIASAGLDGILTLRDTRRPQSRLAVEPRTRSPITAASIGGAVICTGDAGGGWCCTSASNGRVVTEGREESSISACAASCGGETICIAAGRHVVLRGPEDTYAVDVGADVRQIIILNPRTPQKAIAAADRVYIIATARRARQELDCRGVTALCASYDGHTIAVGNELGELQVLQAD